MAANPSLLVVDLPSGTAADVRGWGIRRGWGSRGDLSPALAAVVG